jgi:hypothetical protein
MSEREFQAHIPGYLHLDIGQWLRGDDEFERPIRGEDEFSILRGWYVSTWAQPILERNSVDGLMLDTTWKVIRKYVTPIIMAVYRNMAVLGIRIRRRRDRGALTAALRVIQSLILD